MLSPNPLSLICALLLCLPFAIVFTINSPTTTIGSHTLDYPKVIPLPTLYFPKTHRKVNSFLSIPAPPPPPPPALPEDDGLLFREAARVNSKPFPPGAPKKLAFMFLTTSPLPFAPLWELFFQKTPSDRFNIYVHADPSRQYHPPFSGVFAHRVIPSKPAERFTSTLAAAARRLLAHALLHDSANAMFALLSPSCVPLHSFHFTYKTLIRSKKSFIEILENETGAYDRWAARGPDVMLPEVKLADFRIGSQFWAVTRKHARVVVRDEKVWSKFDLPCARWDTCYPEENYFPTLLSMRDPGGLVPATLTHVDWRGRHDGHPRTYEGSEVGPDLIEGLRKARPRYGDGRDGSNSSSSSWSNAKSQHPFLFARKFSADSLEPLMNISSDVIFKD